MSEQTTFDLTENIKLDKEIIYDYPLTTIFTNEIKNDGGIFQVPVTYSIDNNFYYTTDGTTSEFNFTKMHIGKAYHTNIENVSKDNPNMIGELVLQHSSNCYVCFFIEKSATAQRNILEAVLSKDSANYEIELNNIIPKQDSCIQLKDGRNNIFIFTTPIYVSSNLTKIDSDVSNLFSTNYNKNYIVIPAKNISKRQDDDIYIDCTPTGASEEELNTYNVPINSKMMSEKQQTDLSTMSINFAFFTILSVVGYFLIPMFYKKTVIEMILYLNPGNGDEINKERLKAIKAADLFIILLLVMTISSFYTAGAGSNNPTYTSIALVLSLITILSASLINIKKLNADFIRTIDKSGRIIQLEFPTREVTDTITGKKTQEPIEVPTDISKVFALFGHALTFIKDNLLAAIAAIIIAVGFTVMGLTMSGIISDNLGYPLGAGMSMLTIIILAISKLNEHIEKLRNGDAI